MVQLQVLIRMLLITFIRHDLVADFFSECQSLCLFVRFIIGHAGVRIWLVLLVEDGLVVEENVVIDLEWD